MIRTFKVKTYCRVPGCTRWTRKLPPRTEYLCPGHWRSVPRRLKRHKRMMERALVRRGEIEENGEVWLCRTERAARALRSAWGRCVEAAILHAAGNA